MDGEIVQVNINRRYINFRSTRVKPYYREQDQEDPLVTNDRQKENLPDEHIPQ
jgi:hypothetical protein